MTCRHKWIPLGFRTYRCEKCFDITVLIIDKLMTERQLELFKMYGWKAWRMVCH